MPQMPVWRPLCELNLRDQLRVEPHAILHFLSRQSPLRASLLWEIKEGTSTRLQVFQFAPHFTTQPRDKAISHFACEDQLIAFVVVDDQRVQRVVWRVTPNDERLRLIDLVFQPSPTALAEFITGVLALSDNPLEPKFFHQWNQLGWGCLKRTDKPMRGVWTLRSATISLSSSRLVSSGT
jgi:hypothetical protein